MSKQHWQPSCPDCTNDHSIGGLSLDRRRFLQTSAVAGAAAATSGLLPAVARAADKSNMPQSETLVQQLFDSLTDKQRGSVVFPFDHELRQKVDNNWHITKARVGKDFNADQQQLILDIFNGLHSEEFAPKALHQVDHDSHGKNLSKCSIALFGEPSKDGRGKFEFVLTGRHVTRRCDGNSVDGAAFGGPIFYGHAAQGFNEPADHPGNVYWFQAKRANELYQALDGKQQKIALRDDPRADKYGKANVITEKPSERVGLPVSELSADQKELARQVMHDLLLPFRQADREESMKIVEKAGFDKLHFSYYKNMDIGDDGVWDVWQMEGPTMVWYFRGSPHVHTWVNIRETA